MKTYVLLVVALVALPRTSLAGKKEEAKVAFQKGVEHYKAERYQEAEKPAIPAEERGMPPALIGTLAGLTTALLMVLILAAKSWARRRG